MTVSNPTNLPTTVLSLLNSMFGCSIMVLPLLSLTLSWSQLLPIVIITVLANWYSCQLVLQHLGPWTDVGDLVRCHFHSPFPKKLYDMAAALGLLTASTVYFKLIVLQLQGLVLDYDHSSINTILNAVILISWCIAAKYCDVDTHLSGVGFLSIAAYLFFLLWAALSRPDQSIPSASSQSDPAAFTAVMNNALAIQFIFVPIIKSYQQRNSYTTIIALTFIVTFFVYLYIDGVGAFGTFSQDIGIETRRPEGMQQTVENYFTQGQWQVKAIQSIYLFHLYSVFPQYMLAAKKRVFALFSLPETNPKTISFKELFFLVAVLTVASSIEIANINVKYIITFHGAVFGFIYSYLVPCMFHIKCAYLDPIENKGVIEDENSPQELQKKEDTRDEEVSAVQIKSKQIQMAENQKVESVSVKNPEHPSPKKCYYRRPTLIWRILDWTMIVLMLGIGIFVLGYELKQIL